MMEQLEQAAQVYASLTQEIKEAERKVSIAQDQLSLLRSKQATAGKTLGESIGQNIPRRAFVIDGATVVTIGYNEGIHVFENGEEVR